MKKPLPKIIVVVGPTSSGKSELAVKLAKKIGGEIISGDSRQVYKGMDIGSGKIEGKLKNNQYTYKGIVHYAIDIASPKRQYSVANFQSYSKKIISGIYWRGKIPIICGGTGYWIDAVIFDQRLSLVGPNPALRKKLEKKTLSELFEQLKKLDPHTAKKIDKHNPRRLIRALEIVLTTKKPVPKLKTKAEFNALWIGIKTERAELYKRIEKRLKQRLDEGMIKEVKKLHTQGVSWKHLQEFGLEYKFCALYLQKKLTYPEMVSQLLFSIKHYSKRQETWWKRNKKINWIKDFKNAQALANKFL